MSGPRPVDPLRPHHRVSQKDRLEVQHPGNGEQHRGVFGNQQGAGHALVATLGIDVEEGLRNLLTATGSGCIQLGSVLCWVKPITAVNIRMDNEQAIAQATRTSSDQRGQTWPVSLGQEPSTHTAPSTPVEHSTQPHRLDPIP